MNNTKLRKDANGNIIDKSNKNYHITITENFVTIIEVDSYKKYNILNEDYEDEGENQVPFIDNYTPKKIEKFSNKDPNAVSMQKCMII